MTIIEQAVELECQEEHLIAEAIDGKSCLVSGAPPAG